MAGGILYGLILYKKPLTVWRIVAAKVVVAILVNTCLNTYWLTVMYGNSFVALLPARLLKQLVMVPVEAVLFYLVAKTLARAKVFALMNRNKTSQNGGKKMSYADQIFVRMCKDIIDNGTSTEGEKVRPKWEDGAPAYTIKQFAVVNRYDLSKEFPALTLRRTGIKSCTDEMLWIWQRKSNNIHDLKPHIWDSWADPDGSIGKAYGYQMQVKHQYKEGMMDQVDRVIYDLKHNPYSRRILTNIYVHQDLHEMNLYPCAYSMTFNVTKQPESDNLS